jgi:hypothetical protein
MYTQWAPLGSYTIVSASAIVRVLCFVCTESDLSKKMSDPMAPGTQSPSIKWFLKYLPVIMTFVFSGFIRRQPRITAHLANTIGVCDICDGG